ncbi:hypothetical protein MHBO_003263, partial [Bonamia ostreae]
SITTNQVVEQICVESTPPVTTYENNKKCFKKTSDTVLLEGLESGTNYTFTIYAVDSRLERRTDSTDC